MTTPMRPSLTSHPCLHPKPRRRWRQSLWVCGCGRAWTLAHFGYSGMWDWREWIPDQTPTVETPPVETRAPKGYESFKAMLLDVQSMVWPDTPRADDRPETSPSYVEARQRLQRMLVAEGGS